MHLDAALACLRGEVVHLAPGGARVHEAALRHRPQLPFLQHRVPHRLQILVRLQNLKGLVADESQ